MTNHAHERREGIRYNIDHYPAEVTNPDGTILRALLNDVSFGGFRILCADLTAAHDLMENEAPEVKIKINISFKGSIEKVAADCKITYGYLFTNNCVKNEDKAGEMSFAVGLQVTSFKGKSVQIINKLIQGQANTVT